MTVLKSYAKQEDAMLDIAWLGANGIEATLVDESAYGGNVLGGTTPGAIRIQVRNDLAKIARETLAAKSAPASPDGEEARPRTVKQSDREQAVFRAMILVQTALGIAFWLFPEVFSVTVPDAVNEYFLSLMPSQLIWEYSFDIYGWICLLNLLSSLLLWFFIRAGRVLYILGLIAWPVLAALVQQEILNPLGLIAYTISGLLAGAILAQMYLGTVAARFREPLPGSSRPGQG